MTIEINEREKINVEELKKKSDFEQKQMLVEQINSDTTYIKDLIEQILKSDGKRIYVIDLREDDK